MESFIIRQLIETTERYGSKVAVVDYPAAADGGTADCRQPRTTTFDQLWRNARKVAACILDAGIAPQSFVTIELPQSMEFLAAQLGVWLAHCVAVPVGVNFPDERKTYIREHCDSVLHINDQMLQDILSSEKLADVSVPEESEDALLIYTSGSTGNPKGILHDHRSLENHNEIFLQVTPTTPEDRFAAYAPSYFIAELFYLVLIFGTELHIVPMEVAKDINALSDYHRDHSITMAFVSATAIPFYHCESESLHVIITCSDRVVCLKKPSYHLINVYGLTETAGGVICTEIKDVTDNAPIGLPLKGFECALLDDDLQPVAQGEEGEICLKGHFAKCYFKDEEMTRELYRGGWLHTRDLGRLTPDGLIQFVNRKDWMVKVNGHRVEPGEVEAAMRKAHGVKKAVVKGFPGSQGSQYLVGYYTLEEERGEWSVESGKRMEETIRALLERLLPHYMVPTFFVQLDAFPLNANGKVDRKSLMPPASESLQEDYVAPTNETEALLCQAFAKVLQLPRVGINDDFIQLGGDSIKMMSVQNECPALRLSSKMVYQYRTPRRIAEALLEERGEKIEERGGAVAQDYPLNDVQQVFYGLCKTAPSGEPLFNSPALYKLGDGVDLQRMSRAIDTVVAAHPSMMMKIVEKGEEGMPRIVYDKDYRFATAIETLSDEDFDALLPTLVQPFPLTGAPLLRIRLYQTATRKYLFYDFHHLVFDGVSLQVFHDEINKAYAGEEIPVEEATIYELNAEEEQAVQTEAYEEAKEWFAHEFADGPKETFPIPDLTPLPAPPTFGHIYRRLDIPSHEQLETVCRTKGVTLNVLFMAAGALVIGNCNNTCDVLLSASYHARTELRLQRTFGFLAKPRLMRFRWQQGEAIDDYLQRTKEHIMGNMARDVYPITHQMAHLGLSNNMVLFMYEGGLNLNNITLCGEKAEKHELGISLTANPVSYFISLTDDGAFDVLVVYAENLYSKAYIEKTICDIEQTVGKLIAGENI